MAAYDAGIHLIGWETVKIDGVNVRVFHVKTVFKGIELHAWMDEGGTVVKELSPLGLTVQKEASRKDAAGSFDARLFSAIDTTGRIENPRALTYMKVRVETKDELKEVLKSLYDVQGDTIEVTTEAPARLGLDPRKLLGPSVFVNSDDEQILAVLNGIVAGKTNGSERSQAIMEWVFKNVRKAPTFSLPTAKDVFIKRAGDCNEHAVLVAAFARAAAIPCAIVSGMVYTMENFYYHAWNLVYVDGRWIPVDSTFGQFPADATHIVLAAGDISDGVEIMQFLKNIKLHVKETR
jgi:transglutaminase-like putative cysteine protease